MKKIILITTLLGLSACTDPVEADRVLKAQGFKDVKITGYRWTGCGRDDRQSTGFEAKSINDTQVSGVVCSNWNPFGKSSTVRID